MNQEERNIDHELEQMRQDYAALKEHYDKQQIVTDYLLQKAMKSDVNWLFMEMKLLPILSLFLIAITAAYTFIFGLDFIAIVSMRLPPRRFRKTSSSIATSAVFPPSRPLD